LFGPTHLITTLLAQPRPDPIALGGISNVKQRRKGEGRYFIHVRSKNDNALPMIVTHGWPGSINEQMKIIDPRANPTAHGVSNWIRSASM
jgi:hypothetical protein